MSWLLVAAVIVAAGWAAALREDLIHARQKPAPSRWCGLCGRSTCHHCTTRGRK